MCVNYQKEIQNIYVLMKIDEVMPLLSVSLFFCTFGNSNA